MGAFKEQYAALEAEGVYIGGWSFKNLLIPKKSGGEHDSSEDRIQAMTALDKDWPPEEELALVRKLDIRLLPTCFVIFMLAYLDRGNIGSIRILQHGGPDSLETTLKLEGTDFNWASDAVSATYFVMTAVLLPSILLLKRFSAKIYCPTVMVLWGGIVMCMAATKNAAGLIAARFFLGVPESGIVPCIAFYFSFWYLPKKRAFRLGILFSANALGVGTSNLLAIAIDNLNGKGGLRSWQWSFLLEGLASVLFAIPTYFALLTFPETEKSLSERERHIAINRFGRGSTRKTDVTWDTPAFIRIMSRPSTYLFFVSYICVFIMISSMSNFLPTILLDFLGFSSLKANLYAAAAAFVQIPLFWLWPFHSDWTRERMWHYVIPLLGSIPAYVIWAYASSNPGQTTVGPLALYGMAFLAQLPIISQPILVAYRTATLYGATEQAVGVSVAFAAMSIASIIAPQMYPTSDAPLYKPAFTSNCVILGIAIATYLALPYCLYREARVRKLKTGHAMPLRAMEDAEQSQVTEAAHQYIHDINLHEEQTLKETKNMPAASHVEHRDV